MQTKFRALNFVDMCRTRSDASEICESPQALKYSVGDHAPSKSDTSIPLLMSAKFTSVPDFSQLCPNGKVGVELTAHRGGNIHLMSQEIGPFLTSDCRILMLNERVARVNQVQQTFRRCLHWNWRD